LAEDKQFGSTTQYQAAGKVHRVPSRISGFINEDLRGDVSLKDMEEFNGFADKPEYLLGTAVSSNQLAF
jgi:hypothetical protein